MKLSYRTGYSVRQPIFLKQKRMYRESMGGDDYLKREAINEIMSGVNQDKNATLQNPKEILDRGNVRELEMKLGASLAKPWWDLGAHEELGPRQPEDDEALVKESRTSDMNYENRLSPNPALEAQQSTSQNIKSIKDRLDKERAMKRKIMKRKL